MPRTKSLLFDDDVVDTFAQAGMNFTIDEMLAKWVKGEAPREVTARGISQAIVALTATPTRFGGWEERHGREVLRKIVEKYPALYTPDRKEQQS